MLKEKTGSSLGSGNSRRGCWVRVRVMLRFLHLRHKYETLPPTATRVTSSVVVKQTVLFTMLQSFLTIHEE